MPTVLIIDDEPSILHAFRRGFRDGDFEVRTASSAAEGLRIVEEKKPDVAVIDVHLPDATGLEAFERIRAVDARIPVILITGHGTTDLAIEAMKRGAFEYLLKPLDLTQIRELVTRACASSRLMQVPAVVADEEPVAEHADALVGRCPAMQEVYKAIGRVATTDATVLILGESGTGKELVARAIYQHSRRSERPFLAINCAAIPEALLESELFGHEKGAFTGADRKRIGKFEQCTGGTLFLDEVGDMAPLTQAKLLRLLQEQAFEPVGGNETIRTDVRLIAATNSELERLVADGRFRNDLYFRLNVFTIRLPPLREPRRRPDVANRLFSEAICPRTQAAGDSYCAPRPSKSCGVTAGPAMSANCKACSSRPFCKRRRACCCPNSYGRPFSYRHRLRLPRPPSLIGTAMSPAASIKARRTFMAKPWP